MMTRCTACAQRVREVQQIDKLVESTELNYTSVASTTLGVSYRTFLEALIGGESNPSAIAPLARGRLRAKTEQLRATFQRSFTCHHGTLSWLHVDRIDLIDTHVATCNGLVDMLILEHDLEWARRLLATVRNISAMGAENVIAENGADMSSFETPTNLASRADVCSGQHESAGTAQQVRASPGLLTGR